MWIFWQDLECVFFSKYPHTLKFGSLMNDFSIFSVESFQCGFFHLVEAIKPCNLIPLQVG